MDAVRLHVAQFLIICNDDTIAFFVVHQDLVSLQVQTRRDGNSVQFDASDQQKRYARVEEMHLECPIRRSNRDTESQRLRQQWL